MRKITLNSCRRNYFLFFTSGSLGLAWQRRRLRWRLAQVGTAHFNWEILWMSVSCLPADLLGQCLWSLFWLLIAGKCVIYYTADCWWCPKPTFWVVLLRPEGFLGTGNQREVCGMRIMYQLVFLLCWQPEGSTEVEKWQKNRNEKQWNE